MFIDVPLKGKPTLPIDCITIFLCYFKIKLLNNLQALIINKIFNYINI